MLRLHDAVPKKDLERALETLQGALYQRPPVISAVKRRLRVRTIMKNTLHEFDEERHLAVFSIDCEAGTYIRFIFVRFVLTMAKNFVRSLGSSSRNWRAHARASQSAQWSYDRT